MVRVLKFLSKKKMATNDLEQMHQFMVDSMDYLPLILLLILLLTIASFIYHVYEQKFSNSSKVIKAMGAFLGDCLYLLISYVLLLLIFWE